MAASGGGEPPAGKPRDRGTALAEIRRALDRQRRPVEPLDDARYTRAHLAFEDASTQQSQVRNVIERVALDAPPARVLSVGSGRGALDLPLMLDLQRDADVTSYDCVEPNARSLDAFRARLAAAPQDDLPEVRLFETSYAEARRDGRLSEAYDLIVCIHVLYYVEDKADLVESLRSLLARDGRIVIAHAPFGAMNALTQVFWEAQGVDPFYAEDLRELLRATGCEHEERQISAAIPLDAFDVVTPQGRAILDFLVQCRWEALDAEVRARVREHVSSESASLDGKGRYFPHPVSAFTLRG